MRKDYWLTQASQHEMRERMDAARWLGKNLGDVKSMRHRFLR